MNTPTEPIQTAAGAIDARLARVRRALTGRAVLLRLARALWPLPPLALALLIADAIAPLPPEARLALALAWIALALRAPLALLAARVVRRTRPDRLALFLEDRLGVVDNAIVSAVQLRPLLARSAPDDALPRALAHRATLRAAAALDRHDPRRDVEFTPARRAWRAVALSVVATVLLALIMPGVVRAGLPRFTAPFADHPAYSRTTFTIDIHPATPLVGDDLRIDVTLDGAITDALDLVIVDRPAARMTELDRFPMTARDHARFTTALRDLSEPIRFHVESATGRSRVVELIPLRRPRVREATLRIEPPAYTGWAPVTHTLRTPQDERTIPRLDALVGSQIELRIRTTLPLDRAESSGAGHVEIAAAAAAHLLEIETDSVHELSLRPGARDGVLAEFPIRAIVQGITDQPPDIAIHAPASPGRTISAHAGASIPLRITAVDDVRIDRAIAQWTLRRNGEHIAEAEIPIDQPAWGTPLIAAPSTLNTAAIPARAGDVITLRFLATDNRPSARGGPQTTTTEPITIRIIAPEPASESVAQDAEAQHADQPDALAPAPDDPKTQPAALPDADERPDAHAEAITDPHHDQPPEEARAEGDPDDGFIIDRPPHPAASETPAPESAAALRGAIESVTGEPIDADVFIEQVPPAYRDLVSRYFLRIAREQEPDP